MRGIPDEEKNNAHAVREYRNSLVHEREDEEIEPIPIAVARDPPPRIDLPQDRMKSSRSALIVSACVVGMPCGKPWYVFSVPFGRSFADSGPESA